MSIEFSLDYQTAEGLEHSAKLPSSTQIVLWMQETLSYIKYNQAVELCVRIVSEQESQTLNLTYRGKDSPTNVLSFESDIPDYIPSNHIGDLVICASVVETEAGEQEKISLHHWAHMCIHGLLHLLGYDHIEDAQAQQMESIETAILGQLGIDDPYQMK
jgi:probable rRNA maturation factor